MVSDPIAYSVTITAIAFFGFSIGAIAQSFSSPPVAPEVSTIAILPAPIQPIALLPPARITTPPQPAPTPPVAQLGSDAAPPQPAPKLLPPARIPYAVRPMLPPVLGSPTSDASATALYRPVRLGSAPAREHPAIPSPWEQESDRYWSHNATLTYPNATPSLPGGANE